MELQEPLDLPLESLGLLYIGDTPLNQKLLFHIHFISLLRLYFDDTRDCIIKETVAIDHTTETEPGSAAVLCLLRFSMSPVFHCPSHFSMSLHM